MGSFLLAGSSPTIDLTSNARLDRGEAVLLAEFRTAAARRWTHSR